MRRSDRLRLLSLCSLGLFASVTFGQAKKPARVTFEEHVLPILKDRCAGCHNQDKKRGGLVVNNYTAVMALAASPWAPLVAVGGQKQVLLYHSDTLELLGVLPFPEGTPHVLKFSRNGSLLLAGGGRGGKSGKVVLWGVAKGERLFSV